MKKFLTFSVLVCLLTAFVGCETTRNSTSDSRQTYAWVRSLEEQVEQVPQLQVSPISQLATPTEEGYTSGAWPWGSPKNLIQPLTGTDHTNSTRPSAKQLATLAPTTGNTQTPVIVQINQQANRVDPQEPQEEAPDEARSRLEDLYSGQFTREANRNLEQFGYGFFEKEKASQETVGPVPGGYIVGPGDEIIISFNGGYEAYHRLTVNRDGILAVPEFGTIAIGGQRYDTLHDHLLNFFADRRRGFELTVSIGRLRKISVSVVGRVSQPGSVEIPALATALTAIAAAGGPLKGGSLRKILLRRVEENSTITKSIDLYELLRGTTDYQKTVLLRDGDVIHIPAIGKTIGIAGYVQQPAIYEIKAESITVREALDYAGGLTPFSFTPLAHLEKTVDGRGRRKIDVPLNEEGFQTEMHNGELLMVEAVDDARQPVVRIEGEVARPGDFQHRPGMRISELIHHADGLTINAYLPQALISRQLGKSTSIETITERTSHRQTRRVLVVNLSKALANDPQHDFVLMPLDLVTIRSQHTAIERPEVEIIGSVQSPGKYELTAGMRVSDLIAIARNPTPNVYYDQAELIRRVFDPETRRLDVKRFRFDLRDALNPYNAYSDLANPQLSNGDRLIVRSLQQAQVRVRIEGQVQFPGEYIFPAGAKITDLISASGGLLNQADMRAAIFIRLSTKRLQQEKLSQLAERTRRLNEKAFERMVQTGSSAEGVAAKIAMEQTENTLERMHAAEADGRIVIPFNTPDFPDTNFNLVLENGDTLSIPQRHSTISVVGHVFRPLSLIADKPITVKKAMDQAGGLTETADKDLLYIIRTDGRVDSVAQNFSRLKKPTTLLAGDVLLVPRKPMDRTFGAQLSDILFIARQAAETALISSRIGTDVDMTLVSPSARDQAGVNADILLDQIK